MAQHLKSITGNDIAAFNNKVESGTQNRITVQVIFDSTLEVYDSESPKTVRKETVEALTEKFAAAFKLQLISVLANETKVIVVQTEDEAGEVELA